MNPTTCARCGATIRNGKEYCGTCYGVIKEVFWARQVLADPSVIILDTETTGLNNEAQIIEFSAINIVGQTLLDTLIRPTVSISPDASATHGIGDQTVVQAPTWPEVWPEVQRLLEQAGQIIIWNAGFDRRLIEQSCQAHGIELADYWLHLPWKCAMRRYARWYGEWDRYHRNWRWQRLNGGHRAIQDCRAVLARLQEMAADERK